MDERERTPKRIDRKRLVEECEFIDIYALQKQVGKRALIATIRENRPFVIPRRGGNLKVSVVHELHRLPGSVEKMASLENGSARLWFWCAGCRSAARKLYFYYLDPGRRAHSDVLCVRCHGLTYQSKNCGGNLWYHNVAEPLKRLIRHRNALLRRLPTKRIRARLERLNGEIDALSAQISRKSNKSPILREEVHRTKRRYKDVDLILQS